MTINKIETPGLEQATIIVGKGWKITYHRLFHLSPAEAESVVVKGKGVSIWDLCFLEDLLQIENTDKGLFLDVGWFPHADPSGTFRLVVVRLHGEEGKKSSRSPYDWENLVLDFETRSVAELLAKIHQVIAT